jgi:Ca-activated chloride channel family protein
LNFLYEQYTLIATQFHWLRPLWLLALIPALVLSVFLWRQKRKAYQWQQLIAPELLPFLLDGKSVQTKKSLIWVLLLAWVISCVAIAGPSWVKRPTPVEKNQNALVILLDLSYSMISEDVKPSRIARARLKIADVLRERKDGQTALIAYAGEAHTVTPISDDSATILSLLSSMHPNLMPLQGSNTEDAIARSIQLFQDAGVTQGDILLVTDGVVPEAFDKIQSLLAGHKIQLNILGVGTTQPAPIPSTNGGFLRDQSGTILTTQLNSSELNQLAQRFNGRYHEISNNNSDIEFLKPRPHQDDTNKPTLERDFDQWVDNGHWLIFLLLPITLFCFRRGLFLSLLLIPLLGFNSSPSYALSLEDMGLGNAWLTKDQKAQRELNKGDAKKAAEQFTLPEWKASAQYRAGDYANAAESFSKINTANGHYNRGNALAKSGKLEDAIKAYDEALKRDANLEDAKKNRALVENLLKQQKDQQQDQNNKDKNPDDKNQENKNNQDSDKKDGDDQNSEDKNKDQDDQNKQDSKNQSSNQAGNDQTNNDQKSNDQESNQQNQQQSSSQSSGGGNAQDQAENSAQQSSQSAQQSSQAANSAQASSEQAASASNAEQQAAQIDESKLTPEQKQALEQWLRRVPDDPAGLLRNKFKYQYDVNRQKQADGELKSPDNHADQRL